MRRTRTHRDPELSRTAQHRSDAYRRRGAAALADLINRSIHALEAQKQP
jgi:hypothetical protein